MKIVRVSHSCSFLATVGGASNSKGVRRGARSTPVVTLSLTTLLGMKIARRNTGESPVILSDVSCASFIDESSKSNDLQSGAALLASQASDLPWKIKTCSTLVSATFLSRKKDSEG